MNTMKQNRRAVAVLYACLSLVVVAVFCFSLFRVVGDRAKKNETPETVTNTSQKATDSLPVTEAQPDWDDDDSSISPDDTTTAVETAPSAPAKPTGSAVPTYSMPIVGGTVTKTFSDSVATFSQTMEDYRVHTGIDLYAPVGTAVVCCSDGVVEKVWQDPFDGTCVLVDHGSDLKSLYCNLSEELPKEIAAGATVLEGETIGGVGETMIIEGADTSHLHFEMHQNNTPVDPMTYLAAEGEESGYEDEVIS